MASIWLKAVPRQSKIFSKRRWVCLSIRRELGQRIIITLQRWARKWAISHYVMSTNLANSLIGFVCCSSVCAVLRSYARPRGTCYLNYTAISRSAHSTLQLHTITPRIFSKPWTLWKRKIFRQLKSGSLLSQNYRILKRSSNGYWTSWNISEILNLNERSKYRTFIICGLQVKIRNPIIVAKPWTLWKRIYFWEFKPDPIKSQKFFQI